MVPLTETKNTTKLELEESEGKEKSSLGPCFVVD